MGNVNEKSRLKEIFDKIDSDHSGVLRLDDLLSMQTIPGVSPLITRSPMLLFRFDQAKRGSLNLVSLVNLISFVRTVERSHLRSRLRLPPDLPPPEEAREIDLAALAGDDRVRIACAKPPAAAPATAATSDNAASSELEETLMANAREYMARTLADPESRGRFHAWLFDLADVEQRNQLGETELRYLLRALESDGIRADSLAASTAHTKQVVAQGASQAPAEVSSASPESGAVDAGEESKERKILEEYDATRTGYLTREEFSSLADVILKNYELLSTDKSDHVGRFSLLRKVGEGSSGVVRIGVDKATGEKKAIKVMRKGNVADLSRLDTEIKAMTVLRHPNIVTLEEVLETQEHMYFVMPLLQGGNLADHVAVQPLPDEQARHIFAQIAEGVKYCHSKCVCHRDLKLENVLIDLDGITAKVCDFGHAGIFSPGWDLFSTSLVGSLFHVTPEQLNGLCYSGEKVDAWAMGVLLFRMLTGKPPFYTENVSEMVTRIQTAHWTPLASMHPQAVDLLSHIFQVDPEKRFTVDQMLRHQWVCERGSPASQPSLLSDMMSADCLAVNRYYVVIMLHDVILQNKMRAAHSPQDFNVIQCYDVVRDLKFVARVQIAQKDHSRKHSRLMNMDGSLSTAELPAVGLSSPAVPVLSGSPDSVSALGHRTATGTLGTSAEAQDGGSGRRPATPRAAYTGPTTPHTPTPDDGELLHIHFAFKSGNGSDFRRAVQNIKTAMEKQLRAAALVKSTPPSFLNTKPLIQSAALLAQQFREAFQDSLQEEKATVLLIGKTGSGKSCVANKIFGTKLAEVGQGQPVTKHFNKYTLFGKPIVIFDTKGYEVNTAAVFAEEINDFFELHRKSANKEDHVHCVWYLVDGTSSRFEPFEANFCRTILCHIPFLVLVNKSDLMAEGDIESLRKAIEATNLPNCQGVVATVAVDAVGPPPARCTKCGSDDVSWLKKKRQWSCNECHVMEDLQTSARVEEDSGLRKVVEITRKMVPEAVRESFVSGQKLSINLKIEQSKSIIQECYRETASLSDEKLALKRVLRMLARICTIWDISAPLVSDGDSSNGTVPCPVPADSERLSSLSADSAIVGLTTPPPIPSRTPTEDALKRSPSGFTLTTSSGVKHSISNSSLPSTDSDGSSCDEFDDEDEELETTALPIARQVLCMAHPMMQRFLDEEMAAQGLAGSGQTSPDQDKTEVGDGFQWGWGVVERVLGVLGFNGTGAPSPKLVHPPSPAFPDTEAGAHAPLSLSSSAPAPASQGGQPVVITAASPSLSHVSPMVPPKQCLVTTAIAISWAEALMRLHLLLVEKGVQLPPRETAHGRRRRVNSIRKSSYDMMLQQVKQCVDTAFASFNEERVALFEKRLTEQPLPELLDLVLCRAHRAAAHGSLPPLDDVRSRRDTKSIPVVAAAATISVTAAVAVPPPSVAIPVVPQSPMPSAVPGAQQQQQQPR